jgi:hypothetical protein
MSRLTGKNNPIYLPYKSTDEIIREALEAHETVGMRWGLGICDFFSAHLVCERYYFD